MSKARRMRMAKQPFALPLISPSITRYAISQTIDGAIKDQKNKLQPNQYINMFRQFERDFNDNKLMEEFNSVLEESIQQRKIQALTELDTIKALSREIKVKMFQRFINVNKAKRQPFKNSSLDSKLKNTVLLHKPSIKSINEGRQMRRYSGDKIFDQPHNQESQVMSKMKNLNKRFNNTKMYYQMISPIYPNM